MATKEKLLSLLRSGKGAYLSGEELAKLLGVSRAAVWKAVKSLQAQGYAIDAVTNRGYCLKGGADVLSLSGITPLLDRSGWKLEIRDCVDSTNSALRDLAIQGSPEGTVLLALRQTGGRGRMGRSFFSPEDTGLYLSILLRPADWSPDQSLQITTMAAAAMVETIRQVTGREPEIKWVNDLFLDGKKICGILTEASLNLETGHLDYAVLGLGLNLYPPREGFPEDLRTVAGPLLEQPRENLKNQLTAGFLNRFSEFYLGKQFRQAADLYRKYSLLMGRTVLVGQQRQQALVLDINDRCQLVLGFPDGTRRTLSYGEVSIVNSI